MVRRCSVVLHVGHKGMFVRVPFGKSSPCRLTQGPIIVARTAPAGAVAEAMASAWHCPKHDSLLRESGLRLFKFAQPEATCHVAMAGSTRDCRVGALRLFVRAGSGSFACSHSGRRRCHS